VSSEEERSQSDRSSSLTDFELVEGLGCLGEGCLTTAIPTVLLIVVPIYKLLH
jgi:hypothetical protein